MPFVDRSLAKRLEMIRPVGQRCAEVWAEIAGGIATLSGIDWPVTQTFGVGLFGPVSEAELELLEESSSAAERRWLWSCGRSSILRSSDCGRHDPTG